MYQSVQISKTNIESWREFTNSAVKFLDHYRSLLDTYVLDFFTEDLWSQLNPKWRAVLELLTPLELANFLSSGTPLKQRYVWPLSLQALRTTAFTYTLPRKSVSSVDPFLSYLNQQIQRVEPLSDTAQSFEIRCCDDRNTMKDNDDVKRVEDVKSYETDSMDFSKLSSVTSAENFESDVPAKHIEELSKKQGEVSGNVMEVDKKCKDSVNCDVMQNMNYREIPKGRETETHNSISKCEENMNSLRHLCEQEKDLKAYIDTKDTRNLIHPIQQMSVTWGDATSELSAAAGQHKLLQHVFRRHLKPKKQHEIARLALIAGQVARGACDGVMIDVGSGQGHLSRLLAYGHNVRVVCLEAQDEFINGAKKFDNQLEMAVEKMKRRQSSLPALPPAPRHTVCLLEPHMNPQTFREVHFLLCIYSPSIPDINIYKTPGPLLWDFCSFEATAIRIR